jgi:broad specificity phosphatase PhoE
VTTLLLARHGETDWNSERRWQGHADRPLNERGREQARALASELARRRIDAVYASDLLRARETAEIVAARLGLEVRVDERLREVDVGEWSGLSLTEAEERYPDGFQRWQAGRHGWEQGESYEQMGERVVEAALRIAARHPLETVLVVSHGGSIRACQATAAGLAYAQSRLAGIGSTENCAVVELRVAGGCLVTSSL